MRTDEAREAPRAGRRTVADVPAAPPPFEKRLVPEELYLEVLDRTVEALDGAELTYLFVGGIASAALGRPRLSIDIDVIVRPHDAVQALEALGEAGFRTQEYDPAWLFKGERDGVVVDIIFVSSGGVYLDPEMQERSRVVEFAGRKLQVAGPEDLILMKRRWPTPNPRRGTGSTRSGSSGGPGSTGTTWCTGPGWGHGEC